MSDSYRISLQCKSQMKWLCRWLQRKTYGLTEQYSQDGRSTQEKKDLNHSSSLIITTSSKPQSG
jgi:hypothetical protein